MCESCGVNSQVGISTASGAMIARELAAGTDCVAHSMPGKDLADTIEDVKPESQETVSEWYARIMSEHEIATNSS